jgi:hypothetical protein
MPRVFAFAQAGYGRPGLNMMSNEFEPYAIVGAKLVWTPWEWNKSNLRIQSFRCKNHLLLKILGYFLMNQNAALEAQFQKLKNIVKFRHLTKKYLSYVRELPNHILHNLTLR